VKTILSRQLAVPGVERDRDGVPSLPDLEHSPYLIFKNYGRDIAGVRVKTVKHAFEVHEDLGQTFFKG